MQYAHSFHRMDVIMITAPMMAEAVRVVRSENLFKLDNLLYHPDGFYDLVWSY